MNITDSIQPVVASPVSSGSPKPDEEKLVDVARKFEGMLLHEMFKQVQKGLEAMKDTGDEDESSDSCDEQYQSLYWSQLADAVSEKGGIGLYKSFYAQIQQQTETHNNPSGLLNEGV